LGAILDQLRARDPDNLKNVYYTVGVHSGVGGPEPIRDKLSYAYQTMLAFDIDAIDTAQVWKYLPIVANIIKADPKSLTLVSTGNGCHILAHLKTPIRSNKYLEQTKPHYNEIVYQINSALLQAGLPGKADPAIWDAPRILRLPNSINEKKGLTKECKLLQYPGLVPLDLDTEKISGLDKLSLENISPQQLRKNYPKPDFAKVMNECEFMKWLVTSPESVHEPQYQAALGLLGAMEPGDKALYEGEARTAKEIASAVFDKACNSKSLQRGDFENKWEHGTRYGAPKCSTVSLQWIGGCEKCPHHHKINTPLALKSEEHIGSEPNGFWVHGKNGPLHPHYSDLAKVYARSHSYVTCEPDRIFTFDQTHYKPTGQLTVKAWLENNTAYEEHLREVHCVEFVKKVLRSNAIPELQEVDLFDRSILGKLNCKNGVVDIVRGELLPHTPSHGFRYVLPYDFKPDDVSEMFLDWLAEMMQNRVELMDAVLDMMAYCLWPTYDDHVFAYFVGEGRNGKSTLLHLVQELLGRENYTAISLGQLGNNRFAPANLEGRLANLSEESSGSDLSFEELNVIKDLSAGGEILVENKGQKPFVMRNKAKLLFSANKTPRFHESGKAIRSRLLVIPFDHTIENPDANVEKRLLQEVPKICSMLVTRIQDNLRINHGKFLVSRGGSAAFTAQDKLLLAGNSVVEWGRENLESSVALPEDKYIVCHEAYSRYSHWCQENNYKPANSTAFGYTMTHGVLTGAVGGSIVKKVGSKTLRVYPRTQWKEEVIQ
jgi:P4 family phage/plasmid primase-like protien